MIPNDRHLQILEKPTLDCSDIEEIYGDFYDKDLSATLRGRVDAHICSCDHCAQFAVEYAQVVQGAKLLRTEISSKIPDCGVRNRLREALNRRLGISLPCVD